MPKFEYQATDPEGRPVAEVIEANSRMMATVKLREQGLHIQTLQQKRREPAPQPEQSAKVQYSIFYPLRPVSPHSLSDLYSQLAELLEAGVTIHEAVESLKDRVGKRLRGTLEEISPQLSEGEDLSGIVAKYPQIFPADVRAMLKAGETSGNLDQVCAAIATRYDEEHTLKQKLRWPKLYYGMVVVMATLVAPFPWIIARGFSWYLELVATVLLPIITGAVVLLLAGRVVLAIPTVKALIDDIIYHLPWLAPFEMRGARARMLQTLHILIGAGIGMPTALNLAAQASGIGPIEQQLRIAAAKVREQVPVDRALADCGGLSQRVKDALTTAQQSGLYEQALGRLAQAAAEERRNIINKLVTGSLVGFAIATAVPVAAALYFAYQAYVNAIFERIDEWTP